MGLDANWKEPKSEAWLLEEDKKFFKDFKTMENLTYTRIVLFEKIQKIIVRRDYYSQKQILLKNVSQRRKDAVEKLKKYVRHVNEIKYDFEAYPKITGDFNIVPPENNNDLSSIYDMFA